MDIWLTFYDLFFREKKVRKEKREIVDEEEVGDDNDETNKNEGSDSQAENIDPDEEPVFKSSVSYRLSLLSNLWAHGLSLVCVWFRLILKSAFRD